MKPERAVVKTPLGIALQIDANETEIVASDFRHVRGETERRRVKHPLLREAVKQVDAYFKKRLRRFDLPLHFEGTPFQIDVWTFVSQLETGELVSYGDLARLIGRPRAHRGVAAAMRKAPLDLFVPAHRVIGGDGTVRGAGGNSVRRRLLAFEGIVLK